MSDSLKLHLKAHAYEIYDRLGVEGPIMQVIIDKVNAQVEAGAVETDTRAESLAAIATAVATAVNAIDNRQNPNYPPKELPSTVSAAGKTALYAGFIAALFDRACAEEDLTPSAT